MRFIRRWGRLTDGAVALLTHIFVSIPANGISTHSDLPYHAGNLLVTSGDAVQDTT